MKGCRVNLSKRNTSGDGEGSSGRTILTAMRRQWRQKSGYCSIFAAIPAILVTQVSEARTDELKKNEASVATRSVRPAGKLNKSISSPTLMKWQSEFRLPHQMAGFGMLATLAANDDCPGQTIPSGRYTAPAPYVDFGDTTGANNTVQVICGAAYCNSYFEVGGPDQIYTFTLTGRGANPQIQVTSTSAMYEPLIYVLDGTLDRSPFPKCPAGTNQATTANFWSTYFPSQGGTATIDSVVINALPLNVPLHLFIDSARIDAGGSGTYTIRIQDVTIAPESRINSPDFFVRQHYLDFLQREPDPPGGAFWIHNITRCTDPARRPVTQTEADCLDKQMETTSAAFFFSPEFQYTGYFVYRLYKGSLINNGAGRVPTYQEFVRDVRQVASGIIQNDQLSSATIEANKKKFAEEFTARAEFSNLYDPLSNFDYVERLFQTTGINVSAQEKQSLVAGLNNQTETRASVLQKVVDGAVVMAEGNQQFTTTYGRAFYEKEFNAAFVLMEYFGYLKRDPDPAGYQHWLDKLNLYGNYIDAEMVKSFITSPEYRARFGQP